METVSMLATKILSKIESDPLLKEIVEKSPEPYRAMIWESGVIDNPERIDGTKTYTLLVEELEELLT